MISLKLEPSDILLPSPLLLIVEDVGWWQGKDDSRNGGPYRNRFPRSHCLADYTALVTLAKRLSMRIPIAMILGEWDRKNILKSVPGATWQGKKWDNSANNGPWLEQTAEYIREHTDHLEIALHGLCHEYWQDGQMQRSEFHDMKNIMRSAHIVRSHLDAFFELLSENALPASPRLFVPPALHHSFGNESLSMQELLRKYGIDHVTTRFDLARKFSQPKTPAFTWECGSGIVDRGVSPVSWHQFAAPPVWNSPGPIMALHWSNLLHPDPFQNVASVNAWADLILEKSSSCNLTLSKDLSACWRQTAVCSLAKIKKEKNGVLINLQKVPDLGCLSGNFTLNIKQKVPLKIMTLGAEIQSDKYDKHTETRTLILLPDSKEKTIFLHLVSS